MEGSLDKIVDMYRKIYDTILYTKEYLLLALYAALIFPGCGDKNSLNYEKKQLAEISFILAKTAYSAGIRHLSNKKFIDSLDAKDSFETADTLAFKADSFALEIDGTAAELDTFILNDSTNLDRLKKEIKKLRHDINYFLNHLPK